LALQVGVACRSGVYSEGPEAVTLPSSIALDQARLRLCPLRAKHQVAADVAEDGDGDHAETEGGEIGG
jgi:hypothetical protein